MKDCRDLFISFFSSNSVLPCSFQERSKQERANLDIVWQLETKNKEIQTLSARIQKVMVIRGNKNVKFMY